jgi:hypothetical protein
MTNASRTFARNLVLYAAEPEFGAGIANVDEPVAQKEVIDPDAARVIASVQHTVALAKRPVACSHA